jgi:opacity protein-like surface antigen
MVTPRSALELNYSFMQDSQKYGVNFQEHERIHSRMQEATGAYVYSRTFKRYNPFLEAGIGGLIFTPVLDEGTTLLGTKQNFKFGALFGGGLAYELSPSFDIRVEYRGFLTKMPDFGEDNFNTNRYEVISMPVLGVAYHF